MRRFCLYIAFWGALVTSAAQAEEMRFDVLIRGINAAQVAINGRQDQGSYALAARFQTTGLVGALTDASYAGNSEGHVARGSLRPLRAVLEDQSGRERGRRVLAWRDGVGRLREAVPPPDPAPWAVARSPQGALDPLTAFWLLLRARPAGGLCDRAVTTFDGVRVGRLSLGAQQVRPDGLACTGVFERRAGYAPEELAEQRRFPFEVRFAADGAGAFRVVEMRAPSRLGNVVLRRR